jgi:hypothetical protein
LFYVLSARSAPSKFSPKGVIIKERSLSPLFWRGFK